MKFNTALLDQNKRKMTEIFLKSQGYAWGEDGIPIEAVHTKEAVAKVEYDGKRARLSGKKDVHYYRALHLLLQEIEDGGDREIVKEERCGFSETGLLLDCSRNGVIAGDMLQEIIRLCAACGLDQVYLYMEDVYEIPEDPYFGAYRGRYTKEELRELDEYAGQAGVELIPAIQTLAHLRTYLRWPKARGLQDTGDILLAGAQETEDFVRLMIRNASRPFSSRKIHVGMDEADLLGLGKYLKIHGYKERYSIMTEHLKMVNRICQEEGLELMMWSDMFFRLKSPTGDYYDLPEETEFDLPELSENVTLVYWDYYHHAGTAYDKNIRLHKKLTDRIRFAPGGWTWNGISPNYRKAEKTLKEGMDSCRKQGIDKVFCTFWFDNGTETPVRTLFYSAIYFAQLCYRSQPEPEQLDKWLYQLTGYGKREYELLDALDSPSGVLADNENADNPSKYLLYQDALVGLFDGQVEGTGLDRHYAGLKEKLEKLAPRGSDMDRIFIYYKNLAGLLADKSMLGVELRKAYRENCREELERLKNRASSCAAKARSLREARREIWFQECSPFGYEVLDIRFGGIQTRLESAVQRLEDYLAGRVERIRELEEDMLPYHVDDKNREHILCQANLWENIVSAGNIAGV